MGKSQKPIPWAAKLRFFGGHLIISVAVFLLLLLLIWNFWYPRPFFWTDGGSDGLGMVAFVDIIIGPFLTLVIFNPTKSKLELCMDIGLVVLLQVGAMAYGLYTVYHGRPAALVHSDGIFRTLDWSPFEKQEITPDQLEPFGDELPPVIHAGIVRNREEGKDFVHYRMEVQLEDYMIFSLYRNFYESMDEVKSMRLDIRKGMAERTELAEAVEKSVAKLGGSVDDYYYYPYVGRFRNGMIMLNDKGERVDFIFQEVGDIPRAEPPKPPTVPGTEAETPAADSDEQQNEQSEEQ